MNANRNDQNPPPVARRRWILVGAGMLCLMALIALAVTFTRAPQVIAQAATRTPTATPRPARPTRTPTPTQTITQTQTATPTGTLTSTLEATPTPVVIVIPPIATELPPTPLAFVILPAPSVKNNLVGDVISAAGVPVSANYPTLFVDRLDFAMENVRDITVGEEPGAGIAWVRFLIVDMAGNIVHAAEAAQGSPFCAFGQDDSGCLPHDFTRSEYRWPMRALVHSGRYTLIAFAQGEEPDHKGTWTLPFELRLSEEGLNDSDGAVRIRNIEREGDDWIVEVETFGFTPHVLGTHLHFYAEGMDEVEAVGGVEGVFEYPPNYDSPGAYGMSRARIPIDALMTGGATYGGETPPQSLCVAIAHPDESVLVGRGECVVVSER